MKKMTKLYAFINTHENGVEIDEGILCLQIDNVMVPMLACDHERLNQLLPMVEQVKAHSGFTTELRCFDLVIDVPETPVQNS